MPEHPDKPVMARRGRPLVLLLGTVTALLLSSSPISVPALAQWQHDTKISAPEYKAKYGSWEVVSLPEEFKQNTIHAAALPDGKVLLVAGSGNNEKDFNAYHDDGQIKVLKSVVLDPETMKVKEVNTPTDLFCSGHATLQDGNLLIAGGTSGYEKLESNVTKPAGGIILHNEDPNDQTRTIKQGTVLTDEANGKKYSTMQTVQLDPAMKMTYGAKTTVMHSSATVFVQAVADDASYVTNSNDKFHIDGLSPAQSQNVYGQGGHYQRH